MISIILNDMSHPSHRLFFRLINHSYVSESSMIIFSKLIVLLVSLKIKRLNCEVCCTIKKKKKELL